MVPFVKHGDDLVAFFPEVFFREEQEFSFTVDVDENFLSFFDQGIGVDIVDKIEELFSSEFVSGSGEFSSGIDQKLFFNGVENFLLDVALLIFGGEMGVGHNKEISFEIGDPSIFDRFRFSRQIGVQKVRGMFLRAYVLENAGIIGQNQ